MRSEANSFLRQMKASTCCGPHNQTVLVLSKSRVGVLSQIRAELHKLAYHAKEPTQFCDITYRRKVDNGLNFGRIFSNSLPINNLSKVLKPGNRKYTLFIVQGNAFFLKTI